MKSKILYLISCFVFILSVGISTTANALPADQKKLLNQNILYYDIDTCSEISEDTGVDGLNPGSGAPDGLTFPNLDPAAMAAAINQYIDNYNKTSGLGKSVFTGLGETFVSGAKNSNINPFFVVSIAQKETQLGNPDDYNVRHGNNAFGRTAVPSQPHFIGSRMWYKWSSAKASIDYTAPENQRPSGDQSAYMREVYKQWLDKNDLTGLMEKYAPRLENKTDEYIQQVKDRMKAMIDLAGTTSNPGSSGTASAAGSTVPVTSEPATNTTTKAYLLGDSISLRAKSLIVSNLKSKNIDISVNASVSRSIQNPGQTEGYTTSGLGTLDIPSEKKLIAESSSVVIALGTNVDGDGSVGTYQTNMRKLIEKTKSINPTAKIYVVNIFSPKITQRAAYNRMLSQLSEEMNFEIVDVASKNIQTDDNIHPNNNGTKVFAKTISDALGNADAASGSPATTSDCRCTITNQTTLAGATTGLPDSIPEYWRSLIINAAPKHPDSDPRLVAAVLWAENRGWPDPKKNWGVSSAGAKGPFQFIDSTWRTLGYDGDGDGVKDPNNPEDAVHAAFAHHKGSIEKPLVEGFSGTAEDYYDKAIFKRDGENLLSFAANYNGSGAPNGVALKNFPRGQNSDYVKMVYWLIGSNFEKAYSPEKDKVIDAASGSAADPGSSGSTDICAGVKQEDGAASGGVLAGEFAWPVPIKWVNSNWNWFTKPHHDHPSADIPVPEGTDVFSITDGKVLLVNQTGYGSGYGTYITIEYKGALFRYQHGVTQSVKVKQGDSIKAGTLIMKSGNTGFSTGPHLHVSIETGGTNPLQRTTEHCPQTLFEAMKANKTIASFTELPSTGCIGASIYR